MTKKQTEQRGTKEKLARSYINSPCIFFGFILKI